jgi:hypothetical protein
MFEMYVFKIGQYQYDDLFYLILLIVQPFLLKVKFSEISLQYLWLKIYKLGYNFGINLNSQ